VAIETATSGTATAKATLVTANHAAKRAKPRPERIREAK
jgi:hypothetical protein